MRSTLAVALTLGLCAQAIANTANEYAYGVDIAAPGDSALIALPLPERLILDGQHHDWRDMGVVSADGQSLPLVIRDKPAPEVKRGWSNPPVYALTADAPGSGAALRLHIERDGEVIRLDQSGNGEDSAAKTFWIIDTGETPSTSDRLRFTLANDAEGVSSLLVGASDDLEHWRSVGKGSLAKLQVGEGRLERREIQFEPSNARYLRLQWAAADKALVFNAVELGEPDAAEQPWQAIALPLRAASEPGQWLFDWPIAAPRTSELQIDPGADNSVNSATIFSQLVDGDWRRVRQQSILRLSIDDEVTLTDPITLPPARHYRLDIDDTSLTPRLTLRWPAKEVVFPRRGESPWRLSWGLAGMEADFDRATLDLNNAPLSTIVPDPGKAQGGIITLAGDAALRNGPTFAWQRWILWASLLIGAGLLGSMAWRLIVELKQSTESSNQ